MGTHAVGPSPLHRHGRGRLRRSWGRLLLLPWWQALAWGGVVGLAACGGGSADSPAAVHISLPVSAAAPTDTNVAVVEVRQGPLRNANMAYVSVTLCVPGTSTCSQIDDMLLDTGSTGVRVFASALAGLNLPKQTSNGASTVYECAQFINTMALGSVHLADVRIGGQQASALPIQLMDAGLALASDSQCGAAPVLATASDPARNLKGLGANGILGVNLFGSDGQRYFTCAGFAPGCALPSFSADKQVRNPVSRFASNNNGVVVQLPAIPATGASSVKGYLIFGVNTHINNQLGEAQVVTMAGAGPFFSTRYKGRSFDKSLFDSGSNGLFFDDAAIPTCVGAHTEFYCPADTLRLSASILVQGAPPATVGYAVAPASALFADTYSSNRYAFNNLAAPLSTPLRSDSSSPYFDWGLPFYFGRSVYTVMEGQSAGNGLTGPFSAFSALSE